MNTFKKEITYLGKTFDQSIMSDTHDGFVLKPVTKLATFKELDQTSREQHKFHFRLVTFYTTLQKKDDFGSKEGEIALDTDEAYDLAVEFINKYAICDETEFTNRDREEVLNDAGAMISLSMWLAKEKFFPFFQVLMPSLKV